MAKTIEQHPVLKKIESLSPETMAEISGEEDPKGLAVLQSNFYHFILSALKSGRKVDSLVDAWGYYVTYPECLRSWSK
jgi:hypothetical protein